ncbi:hypothetical protein C8Q75DRAFT_802855 [Abortiporus biennis]|nr:hypothetical protein C8Q75DRAFT_802855 [Abortiporus biennis]
MLDNLTDQYHDSSGHRRHSEVRSAASSVLLEPPPPEQARSLSTPEGDLMPPLPPYTPTSRTCIKFPPTSLEALI